MNEEPKSTWKKSWTGPRGYWLWFLLLTAAAFFLVLCIGLASAAAHPLGRLLIFALLCAIGFALVGTFLLVFVRWLGCGRNFKRFLFGLACFITLIALFYAEEDWRGKHDWEQFKREWEAKGERFDRAGVVPSAVPDDQNFALTPVVASSYETFLDKNGHAVWPRHTNVLNRLQLSVYGNHALLEWPTNGTGDWRVDRMSRLDVWQKYYRALAAKTNEFPVSSQAQSPAADVLLALGKYDAAIDELRQAARMPDSRFPLEYDKDDPAAMVLPHLAPMKDCLQVLQLRTLAELQNGQSGQALADVKLMLRLVNSIRAEPILISHLVRVALVNIALQPVWEGLADHQWSDAQLVELDQELAGLDFIADYKLAMRGEMVLFQGGIFDFLRRHPAQLPYLMGDGNTVPPRAGPGLYRLIPSGWFYQNQLNCARAMVEWYLPAADTNQGIFSPDTIRRADAAIAAESKLKPNPYNLIERMLLPSLGIAAKKFAAGQNSVSLARVGIALERYRLAHGEYPESLDALAPQFISRLPHDVINGGPLHYRREANGRFVLYSAGWNEADDGGEVVLTRNGTVDISAGDWVWRYPQK